MSSTISTSILKHSSYRDSMVINPSVSLKFGRLLHEAQKSPTGVFKSVTILAPLKSIGSAVLGERLESKSSKFLATSESLSKRDDFLLPPDEKKSKKKKGKKKKSIDTEELSNPDSLTSQQAGVRSTSYQGKRKKSKQLVEDDFDDDSDEDELEIPSKQTSSRVGKGKKKDKKGKREDSVMLKHADEQKSILSVGKKKKKQSKGLLIDESEQKVVEVDESIAAELARIRAAAMGQLIPDLHSERSRETEFSILTKPSVKSIPKSMKSSKSGKDKRGKRKWKSTVTSLSRIQELAETVKMAEIEKQRAIDKLHQEAEEKHKHEIAEQQHREEQLSKTIETIDSIILFNTELAKTEREEIEWKLYVDCGKLPNPALCDQMTRYLHLWALEMEQTSIEEASRRTQDVMKLLCDLEDLLDVEVDENQQTIQNWKWLYDLLKEFQNLSLNVATYRLLKYVEKNLNRVDIPTADFSFHDDYVDLNIWLRLNLPTPLPNPRRPPKPRIVVNFESLKVNLLFPPTMDGENMVMRVMYLKYDHLSEQCQSFNLPSTSVRATLLEATMDEWRTKLLYKYRASMKASNLEISDFRSEEDIPIVPYKSLIPSPSEHCLEKDYEGFFEYIKNFLMPTAPNILNLRKYTIIGGIYHIDLMYQPPQPQEYVTIDLSLAVFYLPKELNYVPFFVEYYTPTPSLNIVQEPKRLPGTDEADNLIQVKMSWPDQVVFLQPPILCRWDPDNKNWTKSHIHNVLYNTEIRSVSFATCLFGVYAFATLRYCHLPYKDWRIRPDNDDSVTVKILSTVLKLVFNITGSEISLVAIENGPENILEGIIGKYLKLNRLKRHMKEAGVDIFPEADASCYVTNTSEKHEPMETHLYYNIAMLSNCFKFAWSKWNAGIGRRTIILRMKEFHPAIGKVKKTYSNLHVTPQKATFTECSESAYNFSDVEIENIKFSSDLYNLMKVTSGIAIRNKVLTGKKDTIYSVAQFLISTRLLSFS